MCGKEGFISLEKKVLEVDADNANAFWMHWFIDQGGKLGYDNTHWKRLRFVDDGVMKDGKSNIYILTE